MSLCVAVCVSVCLRAGGTYQTRSRSGSIPLPSTVSTNRRTAVPERAGREAVSYTHLTLPTICSV
eukprot:997732-Rhodomonas_salina.1